MSILFVVHGMDPLDDTTDDGPKFEDVANINVEQQLFQCKLCGKKYPRTQNLRVHLAGGDHNLPQFRHLSDKSMSCDFCDMKFVLNSRLQNHIRKVHGGVADESTNDDDIKVYPKFEEITTVDKIRNLFLCRLCGKNYPREHNLRVHLAGGDHNLPQFKTKNKFKWSKNQDQHGGLAKNIVHNYLYAGDVKTADHLDDKDVSMSELPAGQISLSQIKKLGPELDPTAIPLPDPVPVEIHKCNHCPNVYKSKTYLTQHIRIVHEGKRAGACEHCKWLFFKYIHFNLGNTLGENSVLHI